MFVSLPGVQAAGKARGGKAGTAARMKNIPPPPSFDPAAINNPETRDYVAPNSAGSAVVRAQILLDRAHFSPGEIDGHYGDNLRVAIIGYQMFHQLTPTGIRTPGSCSMRIPPRPWFHM